jgi:glutamate N-acetyltransferase/amino-acid N-acetyltransferase
MSSEIKDQLTNPIHPVAGIRLAAVQSNIRYQNRLDLVVVEIAAGATVVGVTTQNAFCAAPVQLLKQHLEQSDARYFLINTGNANAGTGEAGKVDALVCCKSLAEMARTGIANVLPFSTGVIGEKLPVEKILLGLPDAFSSLDEGNWLAAATGILTTDTRPKLVSRKILIDGTEVTVTGFAKGSGMIKPNMATMLAYVFTDAQIESGFLKALLDDCVNQSFNRITVDGDTSTNDCCMLTATGKSGVKIDASHNDIATFREQLASVFVDLATGLIKDAEGASKFVTVDVVGGASAQECLKVAYCVAESPLVKTAVYASDPNWGRILAAVGRAGVEGLNIESVAIYLGDVCIVAQGSVDESYTEAAGQAEMDKQEIMIRIDLGRGSERETVWTSDLSIEYVRINADYRS